MDGPAHTVPHHHHPDFFSAIDRVPEPTGRMANGILVLGGMGLLAVALVSVCLHKIEEGDSDLSSPVCGASPRPPKINKSWYPIQTRSLATSCLTAWIFINLFLYICFCAGHVGVYYRVIQ